MHISAQGRSTDAAWATSSDERIKTNIKDLDLGLDAILKLKPRIFDYTKGYSNNKTNNIGFIAQEVEDIIPQSVQKVAEQVENEVIEDFRVLDSGPIVPILVKALQELKTENEIEINQFLEMKFEKF